MDPHCFWDNGAIFHGYSAFSMTYRQFEKTVKNRVSLGCFLSHMFLAHRHNVPQKIHVSLALLLLASLKLFRKWCGPWNVQLLISHASQSTLDKTNGTKKKERTKSKNRKMKEYGKHPYCCGYHQNPHNNLHNNQNHNNDNFHQQRDKNWNCRNDERTSFLQYLSVILQQIQ